MLNRRGFITGVFSAVAAPAIVRVGSLMPVKAMLFTDSGFYSLYPTYSNLYEALQAVTRKAFIPRLIVQMTGNYVLTEGL